MYKNLIPAIAILFCCIPLQRLMAQEHSLTKLWQTDTLLKVPESVLFDAGAKLLYVSNIDGQPWEKDGKGSIGKVGLDGKIINVDWVKGLNAPKGIGMYKNNLYVADVDNVAVIDIAKGTIAKNIAIDGAQGLNDISVDKNGKVYVTDSKAGKIYSLDQDKFVLFAEDLKGLNGVLAVGNDVYAVAAGAFWKIGSDKKPVKIAEGMEPATDGIEQVASNEFLVSAWNGVIYYVKADGKTQVLLDTREQKSNTADIGYDPKSRTVYVPTFFKNSITAYTLK
ncbi:MAG: ATP/GTP-binding protein [Chitinophagaceae bacterium]